MHSSSLSVFFMLIRAKVDMPSIMQIPSAKAWNGSDLPFWGVSQIQGSLLRPATAVYSIRYPMHLYRKMPDLYLNLDNSIAQIFNNAWISNANRGIEADVLNISSTSPRMASW